MSCRKYILAVLLALSFSTDCAFPQAGSESLSVVPSRPNFTNSTDTVPPGKLQIEFGISHQWFRADESGANLTGTYGFGITRKLDLRWNSDHVAWANSADGARHGSGDNWIGIRYRISEQGRHRPSIGLMYQLKAPTSDTSQGLGSGFVDHSLALLLSKDIGGTRVDTNLAQFAFGSESGWKRSTMGSLALSRVLRGRLGGLFEAYGGRSSEGAGQASALAALTWRWGNRLGSDVGVECGLTPGVARRRLVMGMSYLFSSNPWERGKQAAAMVRH